MTVDFILQWGRDLVIAEMRLPLRGYTPTASLQWGRDLVIAEIPTATRWRAAESSFNGAAIW